MFDFQVINSLYIFSSKSNKIYVEFIFLKSYMNIFQGSFKEICINVYINLYPTVLLLGMGVK